MDRKPCNNGFYFMDSYLYKPVTMTNVYRITECSLQGRRAFKVSNYQGKHLDLYLNGEVSRGDGNNRFIA